MQKNQKDLKEAEEVVKWIFNNNEARMFINNEINPLKEIEGKNKYILPKEESEWKLKTVESPGSLRVTSTLFFFIGRKVIKET